MLLDSPTPHMMSLFVPRRALVVGGTSGIGHGIALALAKRDCEVIVVGRSEQRGQEIVQQLTTLSSNDTKVQHSFQQLDAFDLEDAKRVAQKSGGDVDFLVFSQGMATIQGYTPTKDNIDQKLQLHYFSRIYMARMLAPHMREGSRILSVLSAGVHSKYTGFEDHFDLKKGYSIANAANAAGFYNDAGFDRLAMENPNVAVAHAAPGFVNTNWGTEMPWAIRTMIRPLQCLFGTSIQDCGERMVEGCLNNMKSTGFTLLDQNGNVIHDGIKHTAAERDFIWEKTLEILPDL